MNGKRRIVTLSAFTGILLLSLIILVSSTPASPISSKKAQLRAVEARLQAVYKRADMAVEKYNQARGQLATVKGQIKRNERLLKVAEYNLAVANTQLSDRARDIYKTHDVGVTDVLFAAKSFDELVTQLDMMQRLGNSDVDTVRSIKAYRQEVKDRSVRLDADKKAAGELVAETARQKAAIESTQRKYEKMTAGIKSEINRLEAQESARRQRAAEAANGGGSNPGGGTNNGGTPVDPGGSGHSAVIAIAQAQLGKPYLYGGAGPNSFDCSGLTMFCYAQIGIGLAHGATDQQHATTPVPISALQPGDLVFFGGPSYSGHVGIYVGGGSMIDAPHTGAVVRYDSIGGAWIGGRP